MTHPTQIWVERHYEIRLTKAVEQIYAYQLIGFHHSKDIHYLQITVITEKTFFLALSVTCSWPLSVCLFLSFPFSISVVHKCMRLYRVIYLRITICSRCLSAIFIRLFMHISHIWHQVLLSVEFVLQQVWCKDDKCVCNLSTNIASSTMRWTQQSN